MTAFREGDLEIEFPDGVIPRRFDGDLHRMTHCMKAVDCIFEWAGAAWFLEIKDPDNPRSRDASFLARLQSGHIDNDLKYKYRDSYLYEYGSGKQYKTIHFVVLIGWKSIDSAGLLRRTESLGEQMPLSGPDGAWQKPFVSSCTVLNIDSWNRTFSRFPVRRLSQPPTRVD
jgi:hypothetical protein